MLLYVAMPPGMQAAFRSFSIKVQPCLARPKRRRWVMATRQQQTGLNMRVHGIQGAMATLYHREAALAAPVP